MSTTDQTSPQTTPDSKETKPDDSTKRSNKRRKNQQYKKKLDVSSGPHPLQTPWTFWYCKKQSKSMNFETTLVSLGTCNTVEEFWSFYSRLKRPNEIPPNSNLHLFRGTTRPMWENFPQGGIWVLRMKKNCVLLPRMWEELLIACIGETFEEPDILGVVLSTRSKEDDLYLWNANQHLKYAIGEKLKSIMHLPTNCPMEYRTNKFNMERRLTVSGQKATDGENAEVEHPKEEKTENIGNSEKTGGAEH